MTYAIAIDQAPLVLERLQKAFPDGPPMPTGKVFSRFIISNYAPDQRCIVVRWRYKGLEHLECGGAAIWWGPGGVPQNWNVT